MQISEDTKNVVQAINDFANSTLRKKADLEIILEVSAEFGLIESISSLIFQGTIIWNLSQQLKKYDANHQGIELIQKEFEASLEIFRENLEIIKSNADIEFQTRCKSVYLEMSKGCVLNIIDLSYDFSKFKQLQDKSRRN